MITLKGYARGYITWPLHRVVIERMAGNLRMLRAAGTALKPEAHRVADRLLRTALRSWRSGGKEGDPVPVPPALLGEVVLLLLAQPAPKRGRPKERSTLELERLVAELGSKRGAALAVSRKTGEPFDTLRRRQGLRPKQSGKPKKKRRPFRPGV